VVRATRPLILALVVLMVLPAHGASSASPLPADIHFPSRVATGQTERPSPESHSDPPGFPLGAPPKALYPSDGFRTDSYGPALDLRSAIDRHNFPAAWAQGYRGGGVNIAVVDQGLDFGHPDLDTSYAVEGNTSSPYYGWPIAFDPKSMGTYLQTGATDGTWYANTTRQRPGPFEVTHTIKVDVTNDFG